MHSRLENYLAEVSEHLRPLPAARRNEELREMRQHLLNAVAVNQERGQSKDEAAANAVEQFGAPAEVGENIASAWRRGEQIENRRSFWGAAICITALTLLSGVALVPQYNAILHLDVSPTHPFIDVSTVIRGCLMFGFPLWAAGWISGYVFPKRAVLGVKVALLVQYGIDFCVKIFQSLHAGRLANLEGVVTFLFYGTVYGLIAVLSARAAIQRRREVEAVR